MIAALELAASGSPIILLLIALSIITIAIILYKLVTLSGVSRGRDSRLDALKTWADGDKDSAHATLGNSKSPATRILKLAMNATLQRMPRKALQAELLRQGNAQVEGMGKLLRTLELIAMISPLLGLLGTVLGMIQSFQELELAQGSANASVLAGGIWQALLTTACGLVVAIPAAVAASAFGARVDAAAHEIESVVGQFFLIEDTGTTAVEV